MSGWRRASARAVALLLAALLLAALPPVPLGAQSAPIELPDAEPYEPDEFPQWAGDLRRAEIVAVGSLPIALLVSRLFYGFGRFAVESIRAGAAAPAFLPPGIAPPGSVPYTRDDNVRIILGAVSLSGVVALIDFALGRQERSPAEEPEPGEQ